MLFVSKHPNRKIDLFLPTKIKAINFINDVDMFSQYLTPTTLKSATIWISRTFSIKMMSSN